MAKVNSELNAPILCFTCDWPLVQKWKKWLRLYQSLFFMPLHHFIFYLRCLDCLSYFFS